MKTFLTLILLSNVSFAADVTLQCPQGSQMNSRETSAGKIFECLSLSTGKVDGPVEEFDLKNNLRRSWTLKNGVPDGEFKVYGDKKNLLRQGRFVNGKLEGKLTRWYGNGQKQDETNWENGRPQGEAKRYFKDGKILESGSYQAGRRIGSWKFNKENGTALPDRNYGSEVQGEISLQDFGGEVKVLSSGSKEVTWSQFVDVETKKQTEGAGLFARVEARAAAPGWTLQYKDKTFSAWDLEEQQFTIDIPLLAKENQIEVIGIDPKGNRTQFKILVVSKAPEVKENAVTQKLFKGFQLTILGGLHQHNYSESSSINSDFSNLSMGALVNKTLNTSESLEFKGSLNFELINIVEPKKDKALSFTSMDGNFGYLSGAKESDFRFGLFAGLFLKTTDGTQFGFKNLSGPKITPTFRFNLNQKQSGFISYHYAPLFTNGMGLLPSSEIESTFELGWNKKLESGKGISLILFSAELKIDSEYTKLSSRTTGLSIGYGL